MINISTVREFSDQSIEGKLLLSAIAVLTSIDCKDIKENKYGGMTHPDDVLIRLVDLANKIYHEEEYSKYLEALNREKKIDSIISLPSQ